MSPGNFYTPTDADRLRMENDLLALEAEVLRARAKGFDARLARLEQEKERWRDEADHLRGELKKIRAAAAGKVMADPERYEELKEARRDLNWLLRRLHNSPMGWAFGMFKGFRRLEERWLSDS
jgi:hypothetical protein